MRAGLARAMRTAKDLVVLFDAVSDDAALAMRTRRREGLNGALEAVERPWLVIHHDLKALVVVVSTNFAFCHGGFLGDGPLGRLARIRLESTLSMRWQHGNGP
jgi:hypothetical protein